MKLNLRTKLIGGFVIILLLMVVVGLVGIHTSKTIQDRLHNTVEQHTKPATILGVVARRVGFIRSNSLLHLFTSSIDDMNRYESEVADWVGKINTDLDTLENVFKDQATLDELAHFRADLDTYLRIWREQIVPLSRANRNEEALALVRRGGAAGTAAQEAMYNLDELHDAIVATADDSVKLSEQAFGKSQNILRAVILLTTILGLALGIKQSSLIAGAVNTVSKAAQLVAAGDLDQRVTVRTGDEIESMADSFNTMTSNMKKMVEELRHEITERKRAEQALRESQQWLSTMLRSIGDAVIATDAQGLVTLMNPVAEDLTGWDEAEAVGKPLEDVFNIINERTGERAENPVARMLRESIVVGLANHTVLIAKDGTKRPIAHSGAPMRDEEGNIIGTVMVFRDISERREMQDRLVRQEKLAVLGQLAGGVGHELRNPLGAIKNAAYFLNMVIEEPEPEVRETLEILGKEVATSERIISSLLDFARPKSPIQRKVDINQLVQEALSRTAVPHRVEVVSQLDESLPTILADPDQLVQVFGNIILNGIQAMPEGGQLTIKSEAPSAERVAVSFADTGVGIPEENLGKLFEPLFTTKAKGIGLGLALVKPLVEGHGGSIEVESEVGKGTTFTVRLPVGEVK